MGFRIFFLILLTLFSFPAMAQELSIEDAYKAIPHDRTPFDRQQSRLSDAEAKYLDHLFFVTDMALRARVQALILFKHDQPEAYQKYSEDIETMLSSFDMVQTPPALKKTQETIISAIRDQQAFFKDWAKSKGTPLYNVIKTSYTSNPLVMSSHQKLIRAYSDLKQAYPGETEYNVKAFYNHLCALDFI